MKYEHTFVFEQGGKQVNAKLVNHDIGEAKSAMEAHKVANRGKGFCNYWIVAAHKAV